MENNKKINMSIIVLQPFFPLFLMMFFAFLLSMCTSRKSIPIKGVLENKSEHVVNGKKVFDLHCYKCHPSGEAGLGPAITSSPAPGFLMRFQVRQGFGVMPSFSKEELSKPQLDDLMAYIKALKKN